MPASSIAFICSALNGVNVVICPSSSTLSAWFLSVPRITRSAASTMEMIKNIQNVISKNSDRYRNRLAFKSLGYLRINIFLITDPPIHAPVL